MIDLEETFCEDNLASSDLAKSMQIIDGEKEAVEEGEFEGAEGEEAYDDDDEEQNVSLLAMEASLMPKMLDNFGEIAKICEKLLDIFKKGQTKTSTSYKKLSIKLADCIKELHINDKSIEYLIDNLYGYSKRIVNFELKFLKMAEKSGISRADFVKYFTGESLTDAWLKKMSKVSKQWGNFINKI